MIYFLDNDVVPNVPTNAENQVFDINISAPTYIEEIQLYCLTYPVYIIYIWT